MVVGRGVPVPLRCFLMTVDVGVDGTHGRLFVGGGSAAVGLFGVQVSSSCAVVCTRGLR